MLLPAACSQPPATPRAPILLHLAGSTSMEPLLRDLTAAYSETRPYVGFDLVAVGSDAGLELLRRGSADLALVSRPLRPEEEQDLQTGARSLSYTIVAQDGIAVIVNANNSVAGLTLYQLRRVFQGQVSSWEELGTPAGVVAATQSGHITVVSREDGSGTRAMFEEIVMTGYKVTPAALIMPGSNAVRDYVASHEDAIGYLSMGYLGTGVTALAIGGVPLERQTVEDGTYPITRPFLLVSLLRPGPELTAFLRFVRTPAGQAIVRRTHGASGP
jgi:phosphate transport system substrate-binding protein